MATSPLLQPIDLSSDGQPSLRARKKTKIVATVGPASDDPAVLEDMIEAGMNVARLNMSHGKHEDHLRRLRQIRSLSEDLDRPIAVLADLQGPKIRTGKLKGDQPVEWKSGTSTIITVGDCPEGDAQRVGTTYAGLARDVKAGDVILVDDGRMRLRVAEVRGDDVECRIEIGGWLKNNKGMNLPDVAMSVPSLSDKDKTDLAWAIANDIDFVALSFVRTARDVRNLKNRIAETGHQIPIIAKIERPEAVENIDEILNEADGIMVARGDLGIEISIELLPVVQKELILRANRLGKLVITATQMLESMIDNPIPTRAEATDVANAVFDGTDAVMLSGETATGKYPVETIAEMSRIVIQAERSRYLPKLELDASATTFTRLSRTVTAAAHQLSEELKADGLLVFSMRSQKALLLSKRRGLTTIVALCHDQRSWRHYCLFWGVVAILIPRCEDFQRLVESGVAAAQRHGIFREGQTLVVLIGFSEQGVVSIKLHRV